MASTGMAHGVSATERALAWLKDNELPSGGIRVHSQHTGPYPEVTGYLIPDALDYGESDLAVRLTTWEISIQREDGSFGGPDPSELSYAFDTGQVLRGLLASIDLVPDARRAAQRSAEYLYLQLLDGPDGRFPARYNGSIPETVHLYALPPLIHAADVFTRPEYRVAANRSLVSYLAHRDLLAPNTLTHYLGYELEALIDLGQTELALPVLESLCARQSTDGSIPAHPGVDWACTPGLAQIAVCWYKVGWPEPADRALSWLQERQTATGGFLGSHGPGADYFPNVEIPWAVKYYLDASQLAHRTHLERQALYQALKTEAAKSLLVKPLQVAEVNTLLVDAIALRIRAQSELALKDEETTNRERSLRLEAEERERSLREEHRLALIELRDHIRSEMNAQEENLLEEIEQLTAKSALNEQALIAERDQYWSQLNFVFSTKAWRASTAVWAARSKGALAPLYLALSIAKYALRIGYHLTVPFALRRDLWFRRHTGKPYRAYAAREEE